MTKKTNTNTEMNNRTISEIIENGTDQEVLEAFLQFVTTRVSITTGYTRNDEGVVTHAMTILRCGDLEGASVPQALSVPFLPLEPKTEETVN